MTYLLALILIGCAKITATFSLTGSWSCSSVNQTWTYNTDKTFSMVTDCYTGHGTYTFNGQSLVISGLSQTSDTQPCSLVNPYSDPHTFQLSFPDINTYSVGPSVDDRCTRNT